MRRFQIRSDRQRQIKTEILVILPYQGPRWRNQRSDFPLLFELLPIELNYLRYSACWLSICLLASRVRTNCLLAPHVKQPPRKTRCFNTCKPSKALLPTIPPVTQSNIPSLPLYRLKENHKTDQSEFQTTHMHHTIHHTGSDINQFALISFSSTKERTKTDPCTAQPLKLDEMVSKR